jgi:hypothetical protein
MEFLGRMYVAAPPNGLDMWMKNSQGLVRSRRGTPGSAAFFFFETKKSDYDTNLDLDSPIY